MASEAPVLGFLREAKGRKPTDIFVGISRSRADSILDDGIGGERGTTLDESFGPEFT